MRYVCIVGGGPAGLGVASMLGKLGMEFQLFDAGEPVEARRHDCADHLGCGIGGAGLFSDGKFSYFPSGTQLYELANQPRLREAYAEAANVLREIGLEAPDFPAGRFDLSSNGNGVALKPYASQYGTLTQRHELIRILAGQHAPQRITPLCHVEGIRPSPEGFLVTYRDLAAGRMVSREFTDVVLATGRFGGLALSRMWRSGLETQSQRYEVGIRIEHPNGIGFLSKIKNNDVKLLLKTSDVEVRTFCTCRHGEVWHIPYGTISALSGRSDGPPTAYSNFGLLPRFAGDQIELGRDIWEHFTSTFGNASAAIWQPLRTFLDGGSTTIDGIEATDRPWYPRAKVIPGDIGKAIHPELKKILHASIRTMLQQFPDMDCSEAVCLFPAIEGIGCFPNTTDELRNPRASVWCCGDVVGRFRGLVPALVSGHYVGLAIANQSTPANPPDRELLYESS